MADTAGPLSTASLPDRWTLVLVALAAGEKHGYLIAQDIEAFAGVVLSPGTLYGAITKLEAVGLIVRLDQLGRRKPYRITDDGRQALHDALTASARVATVGLARLRAR